jgi:hypothetical protein
MIKKQQKWIALLVVCTFMWLMQVSTMPVAAAGTTEQISSASAEQGPDYYEAVSQKAAPAKKKSMLPIILIGVGALTVTAVVLFLFVLKGYDITGTWTVYYTWQGDPEDDFSITFSGDKKSGTFTYLESGSTDHGTYVVDGKNVEWTFSGGTKYTGAFSDKKNMSGVMNWPGTWRAIKISSAASTNSPLTSGTKKTMNGAGKRTH